jgi:uncharacterized membrane protein YkvA (DUF1232 family)
MTNVTETTISEPDFWSKITNAVASAGQEILGHVLDLYFAMRHEMPAWAQALVAAALAYFISPVDAVPDVIPFIGYGDDAVVLTSAVRAYITDQVKEQSRVVLRRLFG